MGGWISVWVGDNKYRGSVSGWVIISTGNAFIVKQYLRKYNRSEVETACKEVDGRLMPIFDPDPGTLNADPELDHHQIAFIQSPAAAKAALRTPVMKEPCFCSKGWLNGVLDFFRFCSLIMYWVLVLNVHILQ